jgi:hypothetical protein
MWTALAVIAGCGRIGFGEHADDGPHGDGGSARDSGGGDGRGSDGGTPGDAGAVGPRALTVFSSSGVAIKVAGTGGEAVAIVQFVTSVAFDQTTVMGQAAFESQAVVRFDANHALVSTSTLDATGLCDIRDAAPLGSDVVAAGLTSGGAADSSYGACAVSTGRQDPVAIGIDRGGAQTTLVPFVSGGTNAQLFHAQLMADGSYVLDGVYGDALKVGATTLPTVGQDTGYYVGYSPASGSATWVVQIVSGAASTNGPIAAAASDVCTTGRIAGTTTVFGTVLNDAGGNDAWLARVDGTGSARYVRQVGTPGNDDFAKDDSILATDTECIAAFDVSDNITLDTTALPVSDGPAIVAAFGPTGALDYGYRIPGATAQLARVGSKNYLAVTISAPVTIGGTIYSPAGDDVIIAEIDATGLVSLAGVVGGAGDQQLESFSAIGGGLVAIGVNSTGAISFGSDGSDSGATTVRALATLAVNE